MKKILLITSVTFFYFSFLSQNVWIDQNARWYYNYTNIAEKGYVEWNYNTNQNVLGKTCQKIDGKRYVYRETGPGSGYVYFHTDVLPSHYTYVNGDTVFHYSNGNFYTLLNFGANVGDSWITDISNDGLSCTYDTTRVIVDSIGTVFLNGQNYRWISIKNIILNIYDSASYFYEGKFVERFGLFESRYNSRPNTLFPTETGRRDSVLTTSQACDPLLITEYYLHDFYCFRDSTFFYKTGGDFQCEPPSVGIEERLTNSHVKLYPSLSVGNQEISIDIFKNYLIINNIKLYSLTGKEIILTKTDNGFYAPSKSGIYFVVIETNKGVLTKKLIVE